MPQHSLPASGLLTSAIFTLTLAAALSPLPAQSAGDRDHITSVLQTIGIEPGAQPVTVLRRHGYLEAPNWSRDGADLLFDEAGGIRRIPASGGDPLPIATGNASHCNGSHGLSPDGHTLAITCTTPGLPGARIYLVPTTGGTPHVATQNPDSYFHSWSPNGRTIAFARPTQSAINIVTIQLDAQGNGQNETAVTTGTGINDDPDFSPDGQYLYFNSNRGGTMQIWRMHTDGTAPEQLTSDDRMNWTPHPSPDGKWIVYVSYEHGVTGHASNKPIELRLMSLNDRKVRTLVQLTGGSGTINVPSWAPDSKHLAFVDYEIAPANE